MQPNRVLPGATIGIIGGGQLGRMMATAAKHMGYRVVVLDPTEDCPTAQVSDEHIVRAYDDIEAIKQLNEKSDVITYEFENVDLKAAQFLEESGKLPQGAELLRTTQDRDQEKSIMTELRLPVAPFSIVENTNNLKAALKLIARPAVLKTCRGGYDGKGQLKIETEANLDEAIQLVNNNDRCMLEQWVDFDKEISVVLTRAMTGEITFFPVAENEHKNHVLHKTLAPARVSQTVTNKAIELARSIANGIGVVGTFAIEMFVSGDEVYLNEMAPRPHNSGHYTIEACNVSQFEQHIRAICGLPLIPIAFHGAAIMVNLLGKDVDDALARIEEYPAAHIHVYGKKETKPGRKMGHMTFIDKELEKLQQIVSETQEETV